MKNNVDRKYITKRKSMKMTLLQQIVFVNQMGVNGWELFAFHRNIKGWDRYHFRKPKTGVKTFLEKMAYQK